MRADDEADFAEFVTGSSARLFGTAYAMCGDRSLAEEVVQAALVAACTSWSRARRAPSAEAFARGLVVREVLRGHRRRRQQPWAEPADPTEPARAGLSELDLVWVALQMLPARQRVVVVLRCHHGLSEPEIAETLGVRRGTVGSELTAALATLERVLPAAEGAPR